MSEPIRVLVVDDHAVVRSGLRLLLDNADGIVHPGNTITYSLLVHNAGTSNVTGVALSDTIPVGTTFVSASNTLSLAVAVVAAAYCG